MDKEIGVLKFIRRYPVKSMKGEDLNEIVVTKYGIEGDRAFAFIDENAQEKKFPWMTARQAHEMLLFEPSFTDSSLSSVIVKMPDGKKFNIEDEAFEEFLEHRWNKGLVLRHDTTGGCQDAKPVSIFSLRTVEALSEELGKPLAHERFRANLYAQWKSEFDRPFFEDTLVGKKISIGDEVRLRVVKKDSRCVIPTLDPMTGVSTQELLSNIEQKHGGCAGIYAAVEKEGRLKLGDSIRTHES